MDFTTSWTNVGLKADLKLENADIFESTLINKKKIKFKGTVSVISSAPNTKMKMVDLQG